MIVSNLLRITSYLSLLTFASSQDCEGLPSNEIKVFITASSLASPNLFRQGYIERDLELNWYNVLPKEGDWVALFDHDPQTNVNNPLIKISPINQPNNFYRTSFQLPRIYDKIHQITYECLGFWIAYIRNDVIVAQNCAKVHPRWMWEQRNSIGNFTLYEIMIPGTHNSGSYGVYGGIKSENVLVRYKICQDEDILNQFIFGIRSFDLRIASYPKKSDEFHLNHDKIKVHPFKHAIEHIKYFMNATKEIVILDFHRFPKGFENMSTHERFIDYIIQELGEWMAPRSYSRDVTLNELWAANKRLVVMYSNSIAYNYHLLWPGLLQKWGNTMEIDQLKKFIGDFASFPKRFNWAAMAELTPTVWTVLTKPTKGLRYYADKVNRQLTQWFRDEWWETGNIVATDFFHGNDIVEVAINANIRRKKCVDKVLKIMFDE